MTSEQNRELFTQRVIAGRRTYFFDVRQSKENKRYLVISESQEGDSGYVHHRVMVFEEHIQEFAEAFKSVLRFLQGKSHSVEAIRQKYPNAYKPWQPADDEQLQTQYRQGKSIRELAEHFGRQPSAIRSRLTKMGLP